MAFVRLVKEFSIALKCHSKEKVNSWSSLRNAFFLTNNKIIFI
jgi:hypothetical protein